MTIDVGWHGTAAASPRPIRLIRRIGQIGPIPCGDPAAPGMAVRGPVARGLPRAPDGLRWFGELTTGCGPYEWSGGAATCGHLRCAASAIGPGGAWGTAWSNRTRGGFTFVM